MKRSASGSLLKDVSSDVQSPDKAVLETLSQEELVNRLAESNDKIMELSEEVEKAKRRENFATLRLAVKEKLTAELSDEVEQMRKSCAEERKPDRMMMDHFTGQVFQAVRDKLRNVQKESKYLKLELDASKGGQDSIECQKLAKKCQRLQDENAALLADGRKISRLEMLLAYSNKTIDKLRRRQRDVNDLLNDHDAEVAKLQSEIIRLKEENRRITETHDLEREDINPSRLGNASRASTCAAAEQQDDTEFDLVENNMEEMESVSSPESAVDEQKETLESPKRLSPDEREDDAIRVSSPGSEPDDAVAISSPDIGEVEPGAVSDESDQL